MNAPSFKWLSTSYCPLSEPDTFSHNKILADLFAGSRKYQLFRSSWSHRKQKYKLQKQQNYYIYHIDLRGLEAVTISLLR
jgi:hypothetical protein